MPITVLEHISGKEFPASWRKRLKANPDQSFKVIIEPEDEDADMPPEENFNPKFVAEVERRCRDYKNGKTKGHHCKDAKESEELFNQWMNE